MNGERLSRESKTTSGSAIVDPAKQSMLLAALYIAQEQQGYLTKEAIERVAKRLGLRAGRRLQHRQLLHPLPHRAGRPLRHPGVRRPLMLPVRRRRHGSPTTSAPSSNLAPGETSADGRFTAGDGAMPRLVRHCAGHARQRPALREPDARRQSTPSSNG